MNKDLKRTLDIDQVNEQLTGLDALSRIRFGVDLFGEKAVLLSSMQKTATVLMHMFYTMGLDNEILFVDTGFHFHETLAYRDEFIRRYGVNIVTLYPILTSIQQEEKYGCKLHLTVEGQPVCCKERKEKPFVRHMKRQRHKLVFGGLRAAEGKARANVKPFSVDPRFDGYKINPLFDWDEAKVEAYLKAHELPEHPLHKLFYPSIGCQCCTTAVMPGEDPRAGRWRHLRDGEKKGPAYCGINFTDGSGI